jgi:integrase
VATAIATYRPDLPPEDWAVIGEFVRTAVTDCMGKTVYSPRQLFAAATRHVWWCWSTAGLPLDNAVVFHPQVICEFIDAGCPEWSRPTAGNHRARLMRMSEALMPPGARPVRLPVIEPSSPLQPYTVPEQVALRSWANGQVTQYRIVNCHVLLALGLGAGLTAAEVCDVRAGHLHVDSEGMLVEVVGKRARLVPVLAEWEPILIDLADAAMRPDLHVFRPHRSTGYKNTIANFVAKTDAGRVRPTQQRMRATWLVTHLSAGSPVKALVRAAGLDSLESLTRYLRYVPDADVAAVRAAFRNPECAL